jgi:hypothetical protein
VMFSRIFCSPTWKLTSWMLTAGGFWVFLLISMPYERLYYPLCNTIESIFDKI